MSAEKPKGTRVWISAFLSFIACLNVFNAVMLLTLRGSDFIIDFSIMDVKLCIVSVLAYFLVSIITTFVLLGVTFYFMFKGLPADPSVFQRLSKVEASVAQNTNMLENMQIGFFRRLEDNEKTTDVALQKMNINLGEARKETNNALEKQRKTMQDVKKENKKNTDIIKKQATEVTGIRKRVEKIEKALSPAKTKLTSKSKLKAVKGVKPRLAHGLKTMGITQVGQFLTTDPAVIAEKTMELHETVTNLQAQAQLLMVPGIDANDAELLVKAGITSRKELADQDPVQLCRTIVNIANAYVEKGKMSASRVPTIDDVWSWIRSAKL
jgi:predicted flap endonuclease-1-like 5' DNA nuclease